MWIKICGITTLEDAQLALHAGADAVGFVFAPSPRRVTPVTVREITRALPSGVEKIGVFVHASADEIVATVQGAGLTGVQLHRANSDPNVSALCRRLRELTPSLRIVHVTPHDGDSAGFARHLQWIAALPVADGDATVVLVDTRVGDKVGGTGVPFDWRAAQGSFLQQAAHLRLIAAGGLRPENVRQAIETLRPWGVDVSSGVESSPGRKDHARVTEFIRAARAAALEFAESAQR